MLEGVLIILLLVNVGSRLANKIERNFSFVIVLELAMAALLAGVLLLEVAAN